MDQWWFHFLWSTSFALNSIVLQLYSEDHCTGEQQGPVQEEERCQHGSIKASSIWAYIHSGAGFSVMIAFVVLVLGSQSLMHGSDLYLSHWFVIAHFCLHFVIPFLFACTTNNRTNRNKGNKTWKASHGKGKEYSSELAIYSLLIGCMFVTVLLRSVLFYITICMRASVRLHNQIFALLLRAPIAFFDSNPLGRILNRFARDLGNVDDKIPESASTVIMVIITTCNTQVTIMRTSL